MYALNTARKDVADGGARWMIASRSVMSCGVRDASVRAEAVEDMDVSDGLGLVDLGTLFTVTVTGGGVGRD